MLREYETMLSAIITQYGPTETVAGVASVLREWADHFSDLGLKEKAIEYVEMAEKLEELIEE
jgi:hypothetical protein